MDCNKFFKVKEIEFKYKINSKYKKEEIKLSSPYDVAKYLRKEFGDSDCERFFSIYLDNKNMLIGWNVVSKGTVSETVVHPREVFKGAILMNASGLLIAHNHPSGNLNPSTQDIKTTERVVECGKILGIPLLDHIIFSKESYKSLKEEGSI